MIEESVIFLKITQSSRFNFVVKLRRQTLKWVLSECGIAYMGQAVYFICNIDHTCVQFFFFPGIWKNVRLLAAIRPESHRQTRPNINPMWAIAWAREKLYSRSVRGSATTPSSWACSVSSWWSLKTNWAVPASTQRWVEIYYYIPFFFKPPQWSINLLVTR